MFITYEYLEPGRKIYCLRDLGYNVLVLDVEFEGWILNQLPIWPNKKNAWKQSILRTSTPLFLPAVSSLSF